MNPQDHPNLDHENLSMEQNELNETNILHKPVIMPTEPVLNNEKPRKNKKTGLIIIIISISIVVLTGLGFIVWYLLNIQISSSFKIGDYVLYNPVSGSRCEEKSDSCLMFNVTSVNEHGIDIMLSYNLLNKQYWNYKGNNALDNLAIATSKWKQKARILSGQEVADILGLENWSNSSSTAEANAAKYIWLIQNLYNTGDTSDKADLGYWTSTSNSEQSQCMYDVTYNEDHNKVWLATFGIGFDSCSYQSSGIRPVITVQKNDVKLLDYVVHMDDVNSVFKHYSSKASSDYTSISIYGWNISYNKVLLSTYNCKTTCYPNNVQDASAVIDSKKLIIRDGNQVLLYDFKTGSVVGGEYDQINQVKNGKKTGTNQTINSDILIVKLQNKYGLINFDGKTITDIIYDSIGENGCSTSDDGTGFCSAYYFGADSSTKNIPASKDGITGYIDYETGIFAVK